MYWLYHTDACSFGFTEYMPCIMLLALPHRCMFLRVHGAYAMYYDLRYATQMRVPSRSRSIYVMLCLRYATQMCVPSGSRSIHVMSVSLRGLPPMFMYTHTRSLSQLCHLLSIFILTLFMFPFSGKHRTTSASGRKDC